MTQGRLQSTVAEYRAQLLAREAQAEQALQHAYGHTLAAIQPKLDALYQEIHQKQANGEEVPLSWLYEQRRLAAIQQIVTNQINHFAALAQTTAGHLQRQGVSLGQASAQDQLDATVPAGVAWSFGVPSHAALVNLVGATQAGSPLADLFTGFGEEAASNVGKALISGLMNGDNPRTVAAQVQQALDVPRWRALTIARNEMLRAYKSAAVTNYQANSDVVGQWRWQADKSPRTCFPKGTLVQTSRGNIPIEQVQVGDEVLTHTGRYRRVYDTMQRPYSGKMAMIASGDRSVVATATHPFLVERQGQLNWIEAGDIRLTDHVICKADSSTQIVNHDLGDISIEGDIRNANHAVAPALQKSCLASVGLLNALGTMPVCSIDFKGGIDIRQKEVDGIPPSLDGMLLKIADRQCFQAKAGITFWLGFSCVHAIASHRAEKSIALFRGTNPKRFATFLARLKHGWSSAFLGAMMQVGVFLIEYFPATLTGNIGHLKHFTGSRTVDLSLQACENSKRLFAHRTDFCHTLNMGEVAFPCTISSWSLPRSAKGRATSLAHKVKRWLSDSINNASMRLHMLISGVAFIGAKPSIALALPRLRNDERLFAHLTDHFDLPSGMFQPERLSTFWTAKNMLILPVADICPGVFPAARASTLNFSSVAFDVKSFHASIITQHATHIQLDTPVYNIEVEDDHSYVANGFIVHNCAACLAMDGSLHDLSETLDSHVQCRCAPVPVTKSWADILGPLGIDTSDIPDASIVNSDYETGAQWLDSQDEATQRAILGNAKYDAYTNGDITLSDLVGTKSDADWGNSIYERSLADALTAASSGGSSDSSTQNDTPQQPVVLAPTNDVVFPDGLDAQNAFLKQQQADARAALTADERNSIKEYSYLNYRDINSSLRDPSSLDPSDQQWVTEEIAHLDSAVAKGAAPVDMTVYRGVEAYGGTLDYFAQNVGKVVQDNAFGSTSLNVETASRFADDGGGIITIRIPQGYPGLYLGPLSGYELNNNLTPEYEYLLPRGTKFAVIDYVPATADAKAQFIFEVLP